MLRKPNQGFACPNSTKKISARSIDAFLTLFDEDERKNMTKEKEEVILQKFGITKEPYRDSYRYYVRVNGKRYRRTNLNTLLEELKLVQTHKICNIWDEYIESRINHRTTATINKDIRTYETYIADSELSNKFIKDIKVADIEKFFIHCIEINGDRFTRKYWNGIKRVVSGCINYAIKNGWADYNATFAAKFEANEFKPPIHRKKEDLIFSEAEYAEIKSAAFKDAELDSLYYGIILLFAIGIRIGELAALKWADVDLTHKKIHICRETTEGGKILCEHTKTPAGDRFIPLNTVAEKCLKAIYNSNLISGLPTNDNDFIFLHWKKKSPTLASHRAFEYRLYHLQDELEYDVKRSLHDIRRTYATNCYKHGMDIDRLREYMGHTTVEQTRAYIKDSLTSEQQAREILEKIS